MNRKWILVVGLLAGVGVCVAVLGWLAGGRQTAVSRHALPTAQSPVWLDVVQARLQAAEYRVQQMDTAVFQAANRTQNMRTHFSADGVQFWPRTGEDAWQWGWQLVQYGQGTLHPADNPHSLVAEGNRLTYQRGDLVEWYVNSPTGVEQGFTLPQPLAAGSDPVMLDLALTGNLIPVAQGDAILLLDEAGQIVLRYGDLYAFDANGRILRSDMRLTTLPSGQHAIRLEVDVAAAEYPVTIDPTTANVAWIAFSDQDDNFGLSVSEAGDVNGDGFDDVIIGAEWFDAGDVDTGAAFIFGGSPQGLAVTPLWQHFGPQPFAEFGHSVHTAGDVNGDAFADVIVGAPGVDGRQGAVYAFYGGPGGPSLTPDWQANGSEADVGWGTAVSTAGDVNNDTYDDIIFGVPLSNPDAETLAPGRVYVHYGSPTGLNTAPDWVAGAVPASDLLTGTPEFGFSVDTAGDINNDNFDDIIIGAPRYNPDGAVGAAFVFLGGTNGLPAPQAGGTVATASTNVSLADNVWFSLGDFQINSLFGFAVSAAGDVNNDTFGDVVVGAPGALNLSAIQSGAVFLYLGSAAGLSTPAADLVLYAGQEFAEFGYAVDTLGDVDQDGADDVVVGAPKYDSSLVTRSAGGAGTGADGAAFVYRGNPQTGLQEPAQWFFGGGAANSAFGTSVSGAGDVNRDSYNDILVGAPLYPSSLALGQVFAYYGSGPIAGLSALNSSPTTLGNPTQFRATFVAGGLANFVWDFGDGVLGSGNPTAHTYTRPGVFTATVTATNEFSQVTAVTLVTVNVQKLLLPGQGGTITYTDSVGRGLGANVPPGAIEAPIQLAFKPLQTIEERPPSPNFGEGTSSGYYFDLDAVPPATVYLPVVQKSGATTTAVTTGQSFAESSYQTAAALGGSGSGSFVFAEPITVTIFYNEDQITAVGGDETSLRLLYWDALSGTWIDAATTCSPTSIYIRNLPQNYYQLEVCHLSRFSVVGG